MYVQINNIDRNIYMVASVVKNGKEITYKMINGVQLKEVFDSEPEAEAKYEDVIAMTGGGIPLDEEGKIPAEYLPSYVDDIEDLLAVTDTAPSTCAKGDKYYNTVSKKIFTATSADTWSSTGKTPEKDKIYVNTADDPASSWRWSGTDLVMIGGGTSNVPYIGIFDTLTLNLKTDNLVPGIYTPRTSSSTVTVIGINDNTANFNKVLGDVTVLKTYTDAAENEYFCSFIDARSTGNVIQLKKDTSQAKGYSDVSNSSGIQEYVGNITLTKNNTTAWTPTQDYHPATKKYVDDLKVDVTRTEYLLPEDVYGSNFPVFLYRYSMILNIGSTWDISSTGQLDSNGNNTLDILPKMVMYCLNDLLSSINRESYSYIGFDIDLFNFNYDQFLTLELRASEFRNTSTPANVYGFAIKKQDKKENVYTTYSLNLTYSNDEVITRVVFKNKAMQEPTLIPTDNIIAYTPTQDYHPATKKYVDDNMGNIQYSTMPTAGVDFLDEIIQYTGATSNGYTKGYFYVCESDGGDPATYSWSQINVQPQGSSPSPVLPENGTRLLKKAANSVQALGQIPDPQVQDACLVLTDEVIEHESFVPFEFLDGITEGNVIKFPKPQSFKFTGDVSVLAPAPNVNLAMIGDNPQDLEHAQEWLGFNLSGPNPLDNSSWYMFEFIAGPLSPAAELRNLSGIIGAWVCADPTTNPTFVYIDDAEEVATLVDAFGYDVCEYGMEEYTIHADLLEHYDGIDNITSGGSSYKDFIPLDMTKEVITTETYKKSDLYTYNGSEWVYTDRNLSANANWDENDPTAPGYVRGRTHYTIPGSGEELTTLDLSDNNIYTLTEGQPINPNQPEKTQASLHTLDDLLDVQDVIDFYDKLEELYNEGYSSSDKTFIVEYGSRRNQAYVMREEVQGEYPYVAYYIIGKDEQQDTYPSGNSTLGLEFGVTKDYQGSEFIGYYIFMNIYTEVFEAEDSCRVLSVVKGSKDQVVKLDPKYIPQTADWNENNSKAAGYIANRTHYKEVGTETRNIATEDLSEFDTSSSETEESVEYYTSHLEYRKNLESPYDEEGNIKAKDLYTDLSIIYDTLGSGTEVSIKVGDTIVSGKLLKHTQVIDPYNKTDLFVIATDGGELGDDENPMGTVADKFMTDSQNSSGVLLAVSYEMIQESN